MNVTKSVIVKIEENVHYSLKCFSSEKRRTISQTINDAILFYLKSNSFDIAKLPSQEALFIGAWNTQDRGWVYGTPDKDYGRAASLFFEEYPDINHCHAREFGRKPRGKPIYGKTIESYLRKGYINSLNNNKTVK